MIAATDAQCQEAVSVMKLLFPESLHAIQQLIIERDQLRAEVARLTRDAKIEAAHLLDTQRRAQGAEAELAAEREASRRWELLAVKRAEILADRYGKVAS